MKQLVRRLLVRAGHQDLLDAYYNYRKPYKKTRDLRDQANVRLLLVTTLRHDSNAVDIGANVGTFLGPITACAPDGQHFAFEPIPELAERLRREFPSVDVREVALSDHAGRATFLYAPDAAALSTLEGYGVIDAGYRQERLGVELARLDDVLPSGYRPHVIKIDVEGAEAAVLRGAVETMRCHQPLVVFEHGFGRASDHADIYEVLTSCGYCIFDIDGGGPYVFASWIALLEAGRIWNWVAVPGHATVA